MQRDDSRTGVTNVLEDSPPFTRQVTGGTFVVIRGPDRGEAVPLREDEICFGSSSSCDLILTDKTVSRRHLVAAREGEHVVLRDQGSTNGSFIQGSRFKEIHIGYGAEIKVGRTVLKYLPEEEALEPEESESPSFGALIGKDGKMRRLFKLLEEVAKNDATVLIEGETGTGKELVAEEIHNHSPRRGGPFVVFDCGAVPRDLIESALFGHVKGAFTGAVTDRRGAFAEANGGTIFLDEIGELPLELQPALLRALDKKAVRRVGGSGYEKVDLRIIAATHRDLRAGIVHKTFREDLYYRLAVIRVTLPALRERAGDIRLLVDYFVERFSGGRPLRLTSEDEQRLLRHGWPGNVRELRNVLERACVLARGDHLNLDDAFLAASSGTGMSTLGVRTDLPYREAKGRLVEVFEREYVTELVRKHKMNLSAAARDAQMDRKHLRELVRKYGLDPRGDPDLDED